MLSYLMQFWELALVILVVLIEIITRLIDRHETIDVTFKFKEMPVMQPVKIPTDGRGVLSGLWIWLSKPRSWKIVKDFHYSIDGVEYVIPAGFQCDCASIPKFLQTLISPTGVLLIGALIHDYGYQKQCLRLAAGDDTPKRGQKHFDELFRDINIQVNGFNTVNRVSYYMLRLFGFFAWNGLRKADKQQG